MKIIKQATIIFSIYSFSDIISKVLNLSIPGSVIGIVILFTLLSLGIVKEEHIDEISAMLIGNMSLFFVPASLGILKEYKYIQAEIVPFLTICVFMVIVIMVATGVSAQILEYIFNKFKGKKNDKYN